MELIDLKAIDNSLKKLITAFKVVGAKGFPATSYAAGRASAYIQQTWIGYASGQPIPGISKTVDNVQYRNAIQRSRLGSFDWVIFCSDDKIGDRIEENRKEVRLIEHLPFPKSKIGKDGKPYSRIPFRHKRGAIKKALKGKKGAAAKIFKMEKSYVMGSFKDEAGIKRYTYKWAAKDKKQTAQLKGTRLAGVVRFETSTGKGASSAYMTFRTISKNSPPESWIIKARPGIPLSKITEEQTRAEVNKIIKEGIDNDLKIL